jgi:hypothetical protein
MLPGTETVKVTTWLRGSESEWRKASQRRASSSMETVAEQNQMQP